MDRRSIIIEALETNREITEAFFRTIPSDKHDVPVYADGAKWSVQQVLAHLITIERSMHRLFQDILAGGPGSPEEFDIERFNRTQPRKLDGLTMETLLDRFNSVREGTIGIVKAMSEEDLDREGRHAFHGLGKLERFISWAHEHVDIHIEDIRTVISSGS